MRSLHNHIILQLILSLLLSSICTAQVSTDISDCAEIQIQNANLHPALDGFYTRSQDTYNDLPVFQGQIGDKIRYIWWNKYDEFTRWSIGTEKFSSSIEGFMDNPLNEAWVLGRGRSWHVVNKQEWTVDVDMNVVCSRRSPPQNQNQNANPNAKPPPPRGGRPPPRRKVQTPQSQQVIRITGARNNALNNIYYPTNQPYDNGMVYKTDNAERSIYIFHYTYDDMQRWYIGSTLGSDHDVLAFIEGISMDLSRDGTAQIWSEHASDSGQWNDNNNIKLVFEDNQFINNNQQKQPPLTRDTQDEERRNRRRNAQQQRNEQRNEQRKDQRQPPQQQNDQRQPPPQQRGENPPPQQNNQRQQQNTPNQGQPPQQERQPQMSADEARNERRRQMFRRVNKLDLDVESSGKFESGISVRNEPDIIITGSDDKDINTVYFVQPVKYNGKSVYKSQTG
eukprot:188250_1